MGNHKYRPEEAQGTLLLLLDTQGSPLVTDLTDCNSSDNTNVIIIVKNFSY